MKAVSLKGNITKYVIIGCEAKNMNLYALYHRPKSEYAYQYDKNTLHILLRTKRNDLNSVSIIGGDPFDWIKDGKKAKWNSQIIKMEKRYQTKLFDYYFIEVRPKDLRYKYAFLLLKDNHTYLYGSKRIEKLDNSLDISFEEASFYDLSNYFNYPYLNHEDLNNTPSWVKDTVWYQIFLDRFYAINPKTTLPWIKDRVSNDEFYGGNLLGVIDKLPYLKELGITGIYFTPIFEAPSAHKYDTTDYFKIDSQFGTNEQFKELVKKAHDLNIKVILDGVFNHVGYYHEFFQDVIKNGKKSKYYNSFFIDEEPIINFELDKNNKPIYKMDLRPNYKTFAYTPMMPKWNTDDKLAKEYLLDVVRYWIKEYDIDGWRLDVSNEISHDFLREIKKASRDEKKDTFIFGENWDSSLPWLLGDQMDSVMNYDLIIPLWQYFDNKIDVNELKDELISYTALTPKNVMDNMFNLLDTHDTIRMITRLENNVKRLKIAYLMMFTSKGAPNIYYGSEVGLKGMHDPDNRRTFNWDESTWDMDLFEFIKSLIKLRKTHKEFLSSDYHFIDNKTLSYYKKHNNELTLLLINDSNKKETVLLEKEFLGNYINLLTNEKIIINNNIKLNEYEFMILKKD